MFRKKSIQFDKVDLYTGDKRCLLVTTAWGVNCLFANMTWDYDYFNLLWNKSDNKERVELKHGWGYTRIELYTTIIYN